MQTSEWFKDWFNSPYYHILYKHRDENEAAQFIDKLSEHLHLNKSNLIWDLACGKGRHSLYLNKKGYNVVGTDLAAQNINWIAEQSNERLEFYIHDMRAPFRVNYFSHVLNLFTSIGYFENEKDNSKVFKTVYNSLQPGGIFVIDFFNSNRVLKNVGSSYEVEIEKIGFKIFKTLIDKKIIKRIEVIDAKEKIFFEEKVSLLTKEDFMKFSVNAGFKLLETFGDYDLNAFEKENSKRLILIFRK